MVKIKNETLYVVYFDGLSYETNTGDSLKIAYPNIGSARAIISKYSEREAKLSYGRISPYEWEKLSNRDRLIKKHEDRFLLLNIKE